MTIKLMMKYERFSLKDLSLKGEGNLHVIVLNSNTNNVFRFTKNSENKNREVTPSDDDGKDELNIDKVYKLPVSFKKYTIFQKFWGKEFLPKTRVSLFPSKLLHQISRYIQPHRMESRTDRNMITESYYVEIQYDLSLIPPELHINLQGPTICLELKPKFGVILPNSTNDIRSCSTRFCLQQLLKPKSNQTQYCPADLFSGDPIRMTRSILALLENPQDKLRLFKNGTLVEGMSDEIICQEIEELTQTNFSTSLGAKLELSHLLISALTTDATQKCSPITKQLHTACQMHQHCNYNNISSSSSNHNYGRHGDEQVNCSDQEICETDNKPPCDAGDDSKRYHDNNGLQELYQGSVLGHLLNTGCLVNESIDSIKIKYDSLLEFLHDNNIPERRCIFDLWAECLVALDIPQPIKCLVKLLKKFMVCLTVRDCSILIRLRRLADGVHHPLKKSSDLNSFIVQTSNNNQQLMCMVDVIDVSLKPLSKIQYNYDLEHQLVNTINGY